jgi:ElaB/YqjD/DUF883 family membrane-anchored ribosome-binding protein
MNLQAILLLFACIAKTANSTEDVELILPNARQLDLLISEQQHIQQLIAHKLNNDCMVRVLSQFFPHHEHEHEHEHEYEHDYEPEHGIPFENRDGMMKMVAIALTKCIFESDSQMPEMDDSCYNIGNENDTAGIGTCLSKLAQNSVQWTTFNSYLTQVDEIIAKRYEQVDNVLILREYKTVIGQMQGYLRDVMKERVSHAEEHGMKLRQLDAKFNRLLNSVGQVLQQRTDEFGDRYEELLRQYAEQSNTFQDEFQKAVTSAVEEAIEKTSSQYRDHYHQHAHVLPLASLVHYTGVLLGHFYEFTQTTLAVSGYTALAIAVMLLCIVVLSAMMLLLWLASVARRRVLSSIGEDGLVLRAVASMIGACAVRLAQRVRLG